MSTPPLLIPKPNTDITANSLIDIENPAKGGMQQRFYVAHAGTNKKGDNLGMLCFPVTPFNDSERPSHAHAMLRTADVETLQMVDFSSPKVAMHVPGKETPLLCTQGFDYAEKYAAKVLAVSNEASTDDRNPLIKAYKKIFAPEGTSATFSSVTWGDNARRSTTVDGVTADIIDHAKRAYE